MTYRGKVQGGVVVFEEQVALPEGTPVKVEAVTEEAKPLDDHPTLSEILLKYAGKAQGLPSDASINHDHYLYGTPKR